jgi:hypothetical protein
MKMQTTIDDDYLVRWQNFLGDSVVAAIVCPQCADQVMPYSDGTGLFLVPSFYHVNDGTPMCEIES